ncbi:hypothetical protein [Micromonospora sp. NPDC004551]|uniref:hypothetical protein n=1 Tax=Micromonospora sp. NPDC004551 TaxID=3154284 RepID=UPI00339F647C
MKGTSRPRPTRPFTAPRPAGRPTPARQTHGAKKRAGATATAAIGSAAAVVWLATHDRVGQAGVATVFIVAYLAVEVALFLHGHPAGRPTAAGPLADYTPQTVDRHRQWWEASRR